MLGWPDRIDVPLREFLPTVGRVVRCFGERIDSRTMIVGVETDAGRFVVKHARDEEAISWLGSAIRFHSEVSHPAIPPVVHVMTTPDGLAIIQSWARGEVLVDQFDPDVPERDDHTSPYRRFLQLPVPQIVGAVTELIDAHRAVAAAGFVAVDLYDGCLVYDFDRRRLSLIDLDMYRPGPYALQVDRQLGSRAFMAPEEWQRGATVDERTTVFTVGRLALVLLGCDRYDPPDRSTFRGGDRLYEVGLRACAGDPADRYRTAADLHRAWVSITEA